MARWKFGGKIDLVRFFLIAPSHPIELIMIMVGI